MYICFFLERTYIVIDISLFSLTLSNEIKLKHKYTIVCCTYLITKTNDYCKQSLDKGKMGNPSIIG